jgi:cytochrome c oxidase subunit 2
MTKVFTSVFQDASRPWITGFQDPATPSAQGIQDLHNDICFFILLILGFTVFMLCRCLHYFHVTKNKKASKVLHGSFIELAWTGVPTIILGIIAVPSFALLYAIDDASHSSLTFKAVGHQWYWNYELSDYSNEGTNVSFDSYMLPESDLAIGNLRLLEVDNRMVLPVNTHIRVLVTSNDVLHSWAVPSLGIKCDAVPGRLNQTQFFLEREGVFYGQCSELCGANHGFMPIVVEGVSLHEYTSWLATLIS